MNPNTKKKHKHEYVIYDLYQLFACCHGCGLHDYGEFDEDGEGWILGDFQRKYPDAKIVGFDKE